MDMKRGQFKQLWVGPVGSIVSMEWIHLNFLLLKTPVFTSSKTKLIKKITKSQSVNASSNP
jgi:hypothetical protein